MKKTRALLFVVSTIAVSVFVSSANADVPVMDTSSGGVIPRKDNISDIWAAGISIVAVGAISYIALIKLKNRKNNNVKNDNQNINRFNSNDPH